MFGDLMKDIVIVKTKDGTTYPDVAASVQHDRIYTERTDIPIRPGDQIIRRTPAGVEEVFIVEDSGFHKGMAGIPDTYQMRVRRADLTGPRHGTVIYNVTGANARFNLNSVDSSTNIINQAPAELFQALLQTIRTEIKNSDEREKLLAQAKDLERETGKRGFAAKYAQFMALAANHMQVLGPFIPALTQLLTGG